MRANARAVYAFTENSNRASAYLHQEKIIIVWTWMIHEQSTYNNISQSGSKNNSSFPKWKKRLSVCVCVCALLWFSGVSFTSSWSQRRCRSGQVYFGTSANRVWNMKPSVINNGNSENNNPNMTQHQQTPSDTNNNRNNTDSRGFPSPFSSVSMIVAVVKRTQNDRSQTFGLSESNECVATVPSRPSNFVKAKCTQKVVVAVLVLSIHSLEFCT